MMGLHEVPITPIGYVPGTHIFCIYHYQGSMVHCKWVSLMFGTGTYIVYGTGLPVALSL